MSGTNTRPPWKPSEKQIDVLRRMAAGETLMHFQGIRDDGYCAFGGGKNFKTIHSNSVKSLDKHKCITSLPYRYGTFRLEFRLTDLGRSFISVPATESESS